MGIDNLDTLTKEIEYYKSSNNHIELMRRMDQLEGETSDPIVRAVLLATKATSALITHNQVAADEALSRIDMALLTGAMQNYVTLTKASAAHMGGRLAEADRLLSMVLASEEIHDEEQRDNLYEALAQKGFVQADLNQFDVALNFLEMASALASTGEVLENIYISRAYCLQALGRLNEAEECLRRALETKPGKLRADAYYRLGAVQLQREEFALARSSFRNALRSLPGGGIQREDILSALGEAEAPSLRTGGPFKPRFWA